MDTRKAGKMGSDKRFAGKTKKEISDIMKKVAAKSPTVQALKKMKIK